MISMSNISSTGTLHGVIYRGVGGTSSYNELTNRPKMNDVTIDGDKTGHDYGLANLSDIPVVPPSPPSYAMNVHHDDYYTDDLNWIMSNDIQKQWKVYSQPFGHASAGSAGSRGLVPQPQAGWEDKILCAGSGWIDPPAGLKDYSTSEVDTGQKWIDGKTIYSKTVAIPTISQDGWSNVNLDIIPDTIIKFEGTLYDGASVYNLNYPRSNTVWFASLLASTDGKWQYNIFKHYTGSLYGYITIYYTK